MPVDLSIACIFRVTGSRHQRAVTLTLLIAFFWNQQLPSPRQHEVRLRTPSLFIPCNIAEPFFTACSSVASYNHVAYSRLVCKQDDVRLSCRKTALLVLACRQAALSGGRLVVHANRCRCFVDTALSVKAVLLEPPRLHAELMPAPK